MNHSIEHCEAFPKPVGVDQGIIVVFVFEIVYGLECERGDLFLEKVHYRFSLRQL